MRLPESTPMKKILVFDLNGTLVHRTAVKHEDGRLERSTLVRPHVEGILRDLTGEYTVRFITSMVWKNAVPCLRAITPDWREISPLCIVGHETPAPTDEEPWRTVRDVARVVATLGTTLDNIIFVDNDSYKYEGTGARVVIVPPYKGVVDEDDSFAELVYDCEATAIIA